MSNSLPTEDGYVVAAALADCRPDTPVYVEVADRQVILIRRSSSERVHCLDAICPHEGACLAAGRVVGEQIVCPQHHLGFALETGACGQMPQYRLSRYAVRIEQGRVLVHPIPAHCEPQGPDI